MASKHETWRKYNLETSYIIMKQVNCCEIHCILEQAMQVWIENINSSSVCRAAHALSWHSNSASSDHKEQKWPSTEEGRQEREPMSAYWYCSYGGNGHFCLGKSSGQDERERSCWSYCCFILYDPEKTVSYIHYWWTELLDISAKERR